MEIDGTAHVERMEAPSNLLVVSLEGRVEGVEVNYPRSMWTGHKNRYTYDPQKYAGILFKGEGPGQTAIVSNGISNSTVHIGEGKVFFEDLTIESSSRTALMTSWEGGPDVFLGLTNVHGVFETGRWGLFLFNCDDFVRGCEFWGAALGEHVRYGHGFARHGSVWQESVVHSAGAECWKQANRPEESTRWYRDQTILVEDCLFKGWHQPHSGMGGGMVLQGTSANVVVKRSRFDGPSNVYTKAFMVDDGYGEAPHHGSRFYDVHTGAAQEKFETESGACANGWVLLEECGFSGHGSQWYSPMVRVGPMHPNVPHSTARGFQLLRCGVYGPSTKVELSKIELSAQGKDLVSVHECNTDITKAHMNREGYNTSEESMLAYAGAWKPVSEGWVAG